ncbi:MAG: hypothetical protein RBS76_01930 [Acholeplasmatales bacterium]|jgi:hypothetical protein|nr:hypothetical protein [Acholeplasmataceae bacterium]MDY0115240.1 hypothetical protein [Acholeplasmatales bacterium]MCK9233889.1 hypothetical protein [Acholeplasmataceae bacterium]MCK9289422.1 hypothetical protein [Acholeplasmataceae bacterium]MCK9427829.1 hypothetical protein [Acholeplasmataceae bacterium]
MKKFLEKHSTKVKVLLIIEACLIPFEVTLFYQRRNFVDLGILISAILLIAFTAPIYNIIKKQSDTKKGIE